MTHNNYFKEKKGKIFPDYKDIHNNTVTTILNMVLTEYKMKYEQLISPYKDIRFIMARSMLTRLLSEIWTDRPGETMEYKFIAKIIHKHGIQAIRNNLKIFDKLKASDEHYNQLYIKLTGYIEQLYGTDTYTGTESESDRLRRIQYIRT